MIFSMKSLFFLFKTDKISAQDQIYKWVSFFVVLQRGLLGQEIVLLICLVILALCSLIPLLVYWQRETEKYIEYC